MRAVMARARRFPMRRAVVVSALALGLVASPAAAQSGIQSEGLPPPQSQNIPAQDAPAAAPAQPAPQTQGLPPLPPSQDVGTVAPPVPPGGQTSGLPPAPSSPPARTDQGTTTSPPAMIPAAAAEEQDLVNRAKTAVDHLRADPNFSNFNSLLRQAKAVIVVPQLIKAGLIIGGSGGSGVLLARNAQGEWSSPAFYHLGAASLGFQIGAQVSEVVLVIMNDGALNKLLTDQVSLGGDVSVAAGTIGGGLQAATTTNAGSDIYTFASSKGIFGGITLEGAKLSPKADDNRAYYGTAATAREIVIDQRYRNAAADALRAALPPPYPSAAARP